MEGGKGGRGSELVPHNTLKLPRVYRESGWVDGGRGRGSRKRMRKREDKEQEEEVLWRGRE